MAEIAKRMSCSLCTLYRIASSKDELVLTILDRRLHRFGREAIRTLERNESPLVRLRAYLRATNLAVQPAAAAFSRDFATVPGAPALNESHANYVVAMTSALLEEAVAACGISSLNAPAMPHALGRLGYDFPRAKMAETTEGSPRKTADAAADIILAGL